jgi:hypothetical protein
VCSAAAVGRLRVANQRIVGSTWKTPLDAVRFMLAMQGQDFPGVKWSIGLRVPGSTDADVEAAFTAGKIVRSWPMRGTLHVTAAEDLPWMLALLGARIVDGAASRRAALKLEERSLERARELAIRRLEGGQAVARNELLATFDSGGVSTEGQRGYHILFHLSITGTLCLGPAKGKEQAFVLLGEWVKKPRRFERDQALGELARRYFVSHGPATLADYSGWAKLTAKDARTGLALARKELVELTVDGATYFMAASAEDLLAKVESRVRESVVAIPGFDEYLLGYKERSAVLAPTHAGKIVPGGNGMFMPTIVVGGQVRGTWSRKAKAKETVVEPLPFEKLCRAESLAFASAAGAWGRFTGSTVRVGIVRSGPSSNTRIARPRIGTRISPSRRKATSGRREKQ